MALREGRAVEWDAAPSLVERANRARDSSRLHVPVASVCSVAAVDIGRPLAVGVDGPAWLGAPSDADLGPKPRGAHAMQTQLLQGRPSRLGSCGLRFGLAVGGDR